MVSFSLAFASLKCSSSFVEYFMAHFGSCRVELVLVFGIQALGMNKFFSILEPN